MAFVDSELNEARTQLRQEAGDRQMRSVAGGRKLELTLNPGACQGSA